MVPRSDPRPAELLILNNPQYLIHLFIRYDYIIAIQLILITAKESASQIRSPPVGIVVAGQQAGHHHTLLHSNPILALGAHVRVEEGAGALAHSVVATGGGARRPGGPLRVAALIPLGHGMDLYHVPSLAESPAAYGVHVIASLIAAIQTHQMLGTRSSAVLGSSQDTTRSQLVAVAAGGIAHVGHPLGDQAIYWRTAIVLELLLVTRHTASVLALLLRLELVAVGVAPIRPVDGTLIAHMVVVPEVHHIAVPAGTVHQLVVAETGHDGIAAGIRAVHLLLQLDVPTGIGTIIVGILDPVDLVVIPDLANALALSMSTTRTRAGREIRPWRHSTNGRDIVLPVLAIAFKIAENRTLLSRATSWFLVRLSSSISTVLDVTTALHCLADLRLVQTHLAGLLALFLGLLVQIMAGPGHLTGTTGHCTRRPLGPFREAALRIIVATRRSSCGFLLRLGFFLIKTGTLVTHTVLLLAEGIVATMALIGWKDNNKDNCAGSYTHRSQSGIFEFTCSVLLAGTALGGALIPFGPRLSGALRW